MSDLISRKEAIDIVDELFTHGDCYCDRFSIVGALRGLPSAEPERKTGKWIVHLYELGRERYECSECTGRCDLGYDFCPNCSADMR